MVNLRFLRSPWLLFMGALLLYAVLVLPAVGRQGISWDEQNDLWVAQSYLAAPDGWLAGSEIDPSQTRLPMFTVALVYKLLGTSDLITARLVSCLVGGLTLLGVYLYCKLRFNPSTGILACLLLATSPFYLSFARVAFTETDIYLACALTWLLGCVTRLQDRPTLGWAAGVGVVLGLALSAKFTALVVLPAVWYAVSQSKATGPVKDLPQVKGSSVYFWNGWIIPLVWSVLHRSSTAPRMALASFITGLALLTFLVVPPEHLTNPAILQSLLWRAENELAFNPGFILEAAGLHIGSLIFKSGPLIGMGLLLGLLLTAFQLRGRPETRFPVLLTLFYFGGLILLPLAQTFYIVPLLPILAVFAASQFHRLLARRRAVAVGLAALAVILWAVEMSLAYPDYNLNGYQWLGERVIAGRSSIGYRSIVQTPSDGVEQAVQWLNEHAQPGERVRSYLLEWHIVQAVAPNPTYQIENGFDAPSPEPDYVVVEINTQVRQSWWTDISRGDVFQPPYNPSWLEENYNKVFSVPRAFGIEMASVWKKK